MAITYRETEYGKFLTGMVFVLGSWDNVEMEATAINSGCSKIRNISARFGDWNYVAINHCENGERRINRVVLVQMYITIESFKPYVAVGGNTVKNFENEEEALEYWEHVALPTIKNEAWLSNHFFGLSDLRGDRHVDIVSPLVTSDTKGDKSYN